MTEAVPPALFGRWVRAREEEVPGGPRVYRPAGHPLPPARGRDGIELRPDGTFREWRTGPVDAPVGSAPGRWAATGSQHLRLHRPGGDTVAVDLVAVSVDVLQLRWP